MTTATLTSKGQITIPSEVREKLGVRTGDRVEFVELPDGEFALVPAAGDVRDLKGLVPAPRRPLSTDEMRKIIVGRARK